MTDFTVATTDSIASKWNAASNGDTLSLLAGVHAAPGYLGPKSGMTIRTKPGEATQAIVEQATHTSAAFNIESSNDLTISNLTIRHPVQAAGPVGSQSKWLLRIYSDGAQVTGLHLDGLLLTDAWGWGLVVQVVAGLIENCEITGGAGGFKQVGNCAGLTVDTNNIHDNDRMLIADATPDNDTGAVGMAASLSQGGTWSNNTVTNNRSTGGGSPDYGEDGGAFELFGCTGLTVTGNYVAHCNGGVETGEPSDDSSPSSGNSFINNNFTGRFDWDGASPVVLARAGIGDVYDGNQFSPTSCVDVFRLQHNTGGYGGSIVNLEIRDNVIVTPAGFRTYHMNSAVPSGLVIATNTVTNGEGHVKDVGTSTTVAAFSTAMGITVTDTWDAPPAPPAPPAGSHSIREIQYHLLVLNEGTLAGPNLELFELTPDCLNIVWQNSMNLPGNMAFTIMRSSPKATKLLAMKHHVRLYRQDSRGTDIIFAGKLVQPNYGPRDVVWTCWDYLALMQRSRVDYYLNNNPDKFKAKKIGFILETLYDEMIATPDSPLEFLSTSTPVFQYPDNAAGTEDVKVNASFGIANLQNRLQVFHDLAEMAMANTDHNVKFEITRSLPHTFKLLKNYGGTNNTDYAFTYPGNLSDFAYSKGLGNIINDFATLVSDTDKATGKDQVTITFPTGGEQAIDQIHRLEGAAEIKTLIGFSDNTDEEDQRQMAAKRLARTARRVPRFLAIYPRQGYLRPYDGWELGNKMLVHIAEGDNTTQLVKYMRIHSAAAVWSAEHGEHMQLFMREPEF